MNNKNGTNGKNLVTFLSYYGLVCIAIVLLLGALNLFPKIASILNTIAILISSIILAMNAFYYIKGKKVAFVVIYWVSLVLVVVSIILPLVRALAK